MERESESKHVHHGPSQKPVIHTCVSKEAVLSVSDGSHVLPEIIVSPELGIGNMTLGGFDVDADGSRVNLTGHVEPQGGMMTIRDEMSSSSTNIKMEDIMGRSTNMHELQSSAESAISHEPHKDPSSVSNINPLAGVDVLPHAMKQQISIETPVYNDGAEMSINALAAMKQISASCESRDKLLINVTKQGDDNEDEDEDDLKLRPHQSSEYRYKIEGHSELKLDDDAASVNSEHHHEQNHNDNHNHNLQQPGQQKKLGRNRKFLKNRDSDMSTISNTSAWKYKFEGRSEIIRREEMEDDDAMSVMSHEVILDNYDMNQNPNQMKPIHEMDEESVSMSVSMDDNANSDNESNNYGVTGGQVPYKKNTIVDIV